MEPSIKVGDEVRIRWQGEQHEAVIGVVTHNTQEHFCWINSEGLTNHTTRAYANPIKTGRHYDVESFLKMLMH